MVRCRQSSVWAHALWLGILSTAYGRGNDTSPNTYHGHSWRCCNALEQVFGDAVHRPATPDYMIENTFWALQASLSPTCILTPTSAEEVSIGVKILTGKHCQFAVRGGGHTAIPGWANTNDGVLISMSAFKEITVKDGYARVGAGTIWGEVYKEVEKYNVTVAGGRVFSVGVPGFILGGGLTFLTAEYGFACDSVKNFELITGSGDILQVNAQSYPDLFKAMKGSSNNFGIVTNFDLYTFPFESKIYGGTYVYSEDKIPELLSATADYAITGATSDVKSHVISTFAWVKGSDSIIPGFIVYYNGEVDSNNPPEVLKPFADIPMVANTAKMQNTSEVTYSVGYPDDGFRQMTTSITVIADEDLLVELREIWRQELELLKPDAVAAVFGFQPIPSTAIAAGFARGGNALGFKPDDKYLLHVFWFASWTDVELDSSVIDRVKTMVARSTKAAQKKDLFHPFQYLNYAWEDQDPIASYGRKSVRELRHAKRKYDPKGVFTNLVKGGFKIPGLRRFDV